MQTPINIPCARFSQSTVLRAFGVVGIGVVTMTSFAVADSRVERVIYGGDDENSTIIIENVSSVSTGGQTAAAGGSVTTGPTSASSKVETHINSSSSYGSNVQVKVETEKDGVVETKEYSDETESGHPVKVNVSAEVGAQGSKVNVSGAGELDAETKVESESEGTSVEVEGEAHAESTFTKALKTVPNFFRKILSFFWSF